MITLAVLPPSWLLIFLTFSSIKALGILGNSVIALQISKKRLPLGSLKPFWYPATEKAWQGNPPTKTSTGFNFLKSIFRISSSYN